ncbi:NAD(P)-binding protein [Rhizophagus irregularis]|uniref:NAD(P)-binding protein n=3 Tax=Rhizophagus irregularis TaxID=588596 RepID=U9T9C5_RHIID|nr:hypothetical protein GLOIN_2v1551866 [Rhizophagus irregularis DAOM 181602=DAOM 197198]EXX76687.1 hypothetical protein RirG_030840 [Rhizophagus irregularis DAOM 197198w]PKC13522.1 NAD(P)-binding protein [Rhizophagus irregularis]PKC70196.1 NAD(P)-binding protein [Rhizophagus irregularis]PKY19641.1 NAD(P)-binding protein [Rhizophagus irregularis]POG76963.1 hypothetical protein GLOIN_2v1551866 [Rhizophagus irregularis DAOM 181602=DAOM 197198]|eukprot:XP_025183829.1 hypothetical protein GLOIN_2v1551866 [Rhizophagus irregularis DAOM 181602=DAOM 197198]
MAFNGKTILITGATGNVGSSAVKEFLEQGASVIATSRSKASLDKLTARLQENSVPTKKLIPITVDISNDQELGKVANQIREKTLPEIDHVISSSGPWWKFDHLYDVTFEQWNEVMNANVTPHFVTYRNFIPLLLNKPGSSYTLITGASGLVDEIGPEKIPSGITGISQTVLYGISRVARYETRNNAVRFNELLISYRIEDDDTYKKLVSEGKSSDKLTSSSKFGSIFPKIAKSNLKSEVINISSTTEKEEFEKKYA